MGISLDALCSRRLKTLPASLIDSSSHRISFDFYQAAPPPELYPLDDLKQYVARAVDRFHSDAMGYFGAAGTEEMSYGYSGLRDQLAQRILRRDGRNLGRSGVMLVNGAAQGITLVTNAFIDPGDGVVVETPSFQQPVNHMLAAGAVVSTVPVDHEGMDVVAVEQRLKEFAGRGIRPKLIYTIASFHVPTGTCMSLSRRQRLLELAREWDLVILEDNCHYELHYDGAAPPTLLSMDRDGRVVQCDSFSKIIAPGLRIGWIAGASEVIDVLARVRQDMGSSQWIARAMEAFLADGKLDPHLDRLRDVCRRRRDSASAALQQYCAPWVSFREPKGGAYFWLTLSDRIDWEWVRERVAREGVACRPGERCPDHPHSQFLRVAFMQVPESEMERGVAVLSRALAAGVKH